MEFTGLKWWVHKNPAYREACFNQAKRDTIIHTIESNVIVKHGLGVDNRKD